MFFTRISINNPVLATMMMAALMVLGLFSLNRLRVDQFPDIDFPVVVVTTEYPGATPESVESDITRPVEEAVNTVSGIKSLYSRSYEGQSVVIVEFDLTVEPSRAAQDVREKIAIVKVGFRKEVKEPRISRFDPADRPIISFAVSSETRSARDVTTLSDQLIKKRIENVRGVGSVAIVGCRMEHALFVGGGVQTGFFNMQHEAYDGRKLGTLRFAKQYSDSFRNEALGRSDKTRTAPFCKEEFVESYGPQSPRWGADGSGAALRASDGLPLRVVVCLRAYRKLAGLHDLSVLVTTVDANTEGALGRFNAIGVSFDNALKLTRHYLEGFAWTSKK